MNFEVPVKDRYPHLNQINPVREADIEKVSKVVRALYQLDRKDEAFYIYIACIQKYGQNVRLKRLEAFQIEDMLMSIHHLETMWIRTRRGGKSRDLSLLAVFWSICGLRCLWFAPMKDQLTQAMEYMFANPFVASVKREIVETKYGGIAFEMSVLTEGKTASKGKDALIYDEGAKIKKRRLQYEYYKYSRAIVADAIWEGDKHIVHASTPAVGSAFEEEYTGLRKSEKEKGVKLISKHPWKDCWWITQEWVDSEAKRNPKWYIDQEYRCLFVPRGTSLLDNINEWVYDPKFTANCWGIDFNKTFAMVGLYIPKSRDTCYVVHEFDLDWFNTAQRVQITRILQKGDKVEAEDGGFNWYIARELREDFGVSLSEWKNEDKGERLTLAQHFTAIFIDPNHTPLTWADLREAVFHPIDYTWLKDPQHPSHNTDAFMHAVGASPGIIYGLPDSAAQPRGDRFRALRNT